MMIDDTGESATAHCAPTNVCFKHVISSSNLKPYVKEQPVIKGWVGERQLSPIATHKLCNAEISCQEDEHIHLGVSKSENYVIHKVRDYDVI